MEQDRRAKNGRVNWTTILVAALAAIPPSIVAGAAYFQTVETHKTVNSRMTELLAAAKLLAASDAKTKEQAAQHLREVEKQAAERLPAPAK